jgi:hypothetical protein
MLYAYWHNTLRCNGSINNKKFYKNKLNKNFGLMAKYDMWNHGRYRNAVEGNGYI